MKVYFSYPMGLIVEGWIVIYMDNILIFSEDEEEHQKQMLCILQWPWESQLYLKPEKCIFDAEEVEFLGLRITPGHITMDPMKLK
jgi:hypothetical protein